jgi:predicted phosphodiesterase
MHMRLFLIALVCLSCGDQGSSASGGSGGSGGAGGSGGSDGGGLNLPVPQTDGDDLDLGHFERLRVGLVGDTRPAVAGGVYPTQIITHIYQELDARAPDFAVSLGDYVFVSPSNLAMAKAQMMTYLGARGNFHGNVYYVVGNHEGYGDNIVAFRQTMSNAAYFSLHGTVGTQTFKFVIVADDVWTPQEEVWVKQALAKQTAYTFICRHHPSYNTDTNEMYILSVLQPFARTLLIDGHTHVYERQASREIVIGNGGAPLDSSSYYGYVMLDVDPAGSVNVTAYRESDDAQMETFSVTP